MKNTIYFVLLIGGLLIALGLTPKTERVLLVFESGSLLWVLVMGLFFVLRVLYRFITR